MRQSSTLPTQTPLLYPQNLLLNFLRDSLASHARRTLTSTLIYLTVIAAVVWLPIEALRRVRVPSALVLGLGASEHALDLGVTPEHKWAEVNYYSRLQIIWLDRLNRGPRHHPGPDPPFLVPAIARTWAFNSPWTQRTLVLIGVIMALAYRFGRDPTSPFAFLSVAQRWMCTKLSMHKQGESIVFGFFCASCGVLSAFALYIFWILVQTMLPDFSERNVDDRTGGGIIFGRMRSGDHGGFCCSLER